MLRATRREMEKAYRWHRDQSGAASSASLRLLLFYSIECGLKVLLMKEYRVELYDDLPAEAKVNHDIVLALMRLHAPPELMGIDRLPVATVHRQNPQERVRPCDLHQAFRYGIPIDSEAGVVTALQKILAWVKEKLQ